MNEKFRDWYLTVNIAPQEGQIQKRISAIESFCKNINKSNTISLVKLYYGIEVDASFKAEFIKCFIAKDEAFPSKNEEEIKLLAGATLVQLAETNRGMDSMVELFSMAINVFISSAVTAEIYDVIVENYYKDSANLRNSTDKKNEVESLPISEFTSYIEESSLTNLDENGLKKLTNVLAAIQKSQDNLIGRIESNEELTSIYREDSQVLWWLMGEHSNELDINLKGIDKTKACLALGKEASNFISNYPGPTAIKGVLNKMIGLCKGKAERLTLDKVIEQLPTEWKASFSSTINEDPLLDLLPLNSAIIRSKNTDSAAEWYPKFKREILNSTDELRLTQQEFAWQMHLECLALKCYLELNS